MSDEPTNETSTPADAPAVEPAPEPALEDGCPHTLNPGAVCRYCAAERLREAEAV